MITPDNALQFIKDHHSGEIPYTFGKNEYARWMAQFANHALTKQLQQAGVMRSFCRCGKPHDEWELKKMRCSYCLDDIEAK